jgi:hypothetical protein
MEYNYILIGSLPFFIPYSCGSGKSRRHVTVSLLSARIPLEPDLRAPLPAALIQAQRYHQHTASPVASREPRHASNNTRPRRGGWLAG